VDDDEDEEEEVEDEEEPKEASASTIASETPATLPSPVYNSIQTEYFSYMHVFASKMSCDIILFLPKAFHILMMP